MMTKEEFIKIMERFEASDKNRKNFENKLQNTFGCSSIEANDFGMNDIFFDLLSILFPNCKWAATNKIYANDIEWFYYVHSDSGAIAKQNGEYIEIKNYGELYDFITQYDNSPDDIQ